MPLYSCAIDRNDRMCSTFMRIEPVDIKGQHQYSKALTYRRSGCKVSNKQIIWPPTISGQPQTLEQGGILLGTLDPQATSAPRASRSSPHSKMRTALHHPSEVLGGLQTNQLTNKIPEQNSFVGWGLNSINTTGVGVERRH